jgi:hypothetical protein
MEDKLRIVDVATEMYKYCDIQDMNSLEYVSKIEKTTKKHRTKIKLQKILEKKENELEQILKSLLETNSIEYKSHHFEKIVEILNEISIQENQLDYSSINNKIYNFFIFMLSNENVLKMELFLTSNNVQNDLHYFLKSAIFLEIKVKEHMHIFENTNEAFSLMTI